MSPRLSTEEDCVPVLERVSGLKFNVDFYAGYSLSLIHISPTLSQSGPAAFLRRSNPLDALLAEADRALRVLSGNASAGRANPATAEEAPDTLSAQEKRHAAGLMRVNHVGEVCAQALYRGQAAVCREPGPVSYTHLDVYKRQVLPTPARCAANAASGSTIRPIAASRTWWRIRARSRPCLLDTSRCV